MSDQESEIPFKDLQPGDTFRYEDRVKSSNYIVGSGGIINNDQVFLRGGGVSFSTPISHLGTRTFYLVDRPEKKPTPGSIHTNNERGYYWVYLKNGQCQRISGYGSHHDESTWHSSDFTQVWTPEDDQ